MKLRTHYPPLREKGFGTWLLPTILCQGKLARKSSSLYQSFMKLTLCRSCLCLFESDNPSINHIYDLWLYIWLYNYVYMGKTSALDLTQATPVACHSFFQEVQGDSSTTQQEDSRVDTRGLLKGWLWDCATGSTLGTHGFLEKTGSNTVFKPYLHTLLSPYVCSFLQSCFMHLETPRMLINDLCIFQQHLIYPSPIFFVTSEFVRGN